MQRADFEGLFRAMDGQPVTIRLIDPPLHEFLPSHDELAEELANLKVRLQHLAQHRRDRRDARADRVKQHVLERVRALREQNPMLGMRGVRLGIQLPELTRMQVRAIFEAAVACTRDGIDGAAEGDDPARRTRERAAQSSARCSSAR